MSKFDAILIPGGGVRENGQLPIWVEKRLDRAIEMQTGEYIITLSAGTVYKPPPRDTDGFPIFESTAGARYLISRGINPELVLTENCSYDTIGNAYFSRVIHVDPRNFRSLLIITSDFHLPRTQKVFNWVYGLSPVREYFLDFQSVKDEGIPHDVLEKRRAAERASLINLASLSDQITDIKAFHQWLFTKHDAYLSTNKAREKTMFDPKILDTY